MTRSTNYNTKQKELILSIIKKKKHEFRVKELYNDLNKEIGLTTIYRQIDKLVNEGRINKNINKDNITYYQYLEECNKKNHFYLKCDKCGNMTHIDCDCIEQLSNHIVKEHQFNLNKDCIIISVVKQINRIVGLQDKIII